MKKAQRAIIRRQRRKGIIFPLRRRNTVERKRFAVQLKLARRYRAKVEVGTTLIYANRGQTDAKSYFEDIHEKFPEFFQHLLSTRRHVRMLDIGPGTAEYAHNISWQFDNWNRLELHTLSPEQIQPKYHRTEKVKGILRLSSGKELQVYESEALLADPNQELYVKVNHHVGPLKQQIRAGLECLI